MLYDLCFFTTEYKTESLNKIALKKYEPLDTTPEMFPKVSEMLICKSKC